VVQAHFRKTETTRNHPHKSVMVAWMQVKALNKQQTSHIQTILKQILTYAQQLWGTTYIPT
jgi:elongation factor P--beta-lysine ligase